MDYKKLSRIADSFKVSDSSIVEEKILQGPGVVKIKTTEGGITVFQKEDIHYGEDETGKEYFETLQCLLAELGYKLKDIVDDDRWIKDPKNPGKEVRVVVCEFVKDSAKKVQDFIEGSSLNDFKEALSSKGIKFEILSTEMNALKPSEKLSEILRIEGIPVDVTLYPVREAADYGEGLKWGVHQSVLFKYKTEQKSHVSEVETFCKDLGFSVLRSHVSEPGVYVDLGLSNPSRVEKRASLLRALTWKWKSLRKEILSAKEGDIIEPPAGGTIEVWGKNDSGEFEFGYEAENTGTMDSYSIEWVDEDVKNRANIFFN